MSEFEALVESFDDTVSFVKRELDSWCEEKRASFSCPEDAERAIETLLKMINYSLGWYRGKTRDFATYLDGDRIDTLVRSLSKQEGFTVYEPCCHEENREWTLEKHVGRRTTEMRILLREGYIYCDSHSDGWSLDAFGYETLEQAIRCWAHGDM